MTVAVIGGGLSGSLFALKFLRQRPDTRLFLIERDARPGLGLAYGACADYHLLNVPAQRMEVGLNPGFQDWLATHADGLSDALAESGARLGDAYVPRAMFGAYLRSRLEATASFGDSNGINLVRGEAVRLLDYPARGVQLSDGRRIEADLIVLATGNLPPRAPASRDAWVYDTPQFIDDPWAKGAIETLDADEPVLLLGTGLTMVDIVLKLQAAGHRGKMLAVSRRGQLPLSHRAGGSWEPFIDAATHHPPRTLARLVRNEAKRAEAAGIPWQRVIDAVRPSIARLWHSWSAAEREGFLRHLRPYWDVHRHRMAPRVAALFFALIKSGQLRTMAGRIRSYRREGEELRATIAPRRSHDTVTFDARRVVNCTGPRSDLDRIAIPLFSDMLRRGLIAADQLGLGLETRDCAVVGSAGHTSPWLYALGPLTRPAWWEVTATPEINAQIDRLVEELCAPEHGHGTAPLLADAFSDLGAGI
jgi:uncharacterized NAD(P)/FAD-binding protein YdhS